MALDHLADRQPREGAGHVLVVGQRVDLVEMVPSFSLERALVTVAFASCACEGLCRALQQQRVEQRNGDLPVSP